MPSTVMFASPSLTAETSPTLTNNMDYTTDGESYSLFDSTPDLFPNEAYGTPLSPPNDADDKFSYAESPYPITSPSDSKKTAPPPKKRKTWGQQLPEPKTCLAPRKRAKTVDEKEQRRVERVLRNRKAAQISRERKRLEVEQLEREKSQVERRNQELELRVRAIEARNQQLEAQIAQLTGSPPSPAGTTITDVELIQQQPSRTPTTFTDNLFASSDTPSDSQQPSPFSLDTIRSQNQYLPTIDPTSLSPKAPLLRDSSNASSNDMTQHPAAMLCDLQCQSLEQRPWMNCTRMAFWLHLHLMSILINSSVFLAPLLTTLSYISNPYSTTLSPTTISIIIWIFTNQVFSNSSNSMTTSTVTKLLTRLLASNPHLARPLLDATLGLLRYKACSSQFPARDCLDGEEFGRLDSLWSVVDIPPTSKLMTFYWMVKVIEQGRKDTLRIKKSNSQGIDGRAVDKWTTSRLDMADGSNS